MPVSHDDQAGRFENSCCQNIRIVNTLKNVNGCSLPEDGGSSSNGVPFGKMFNPANYRTASTPYRLSPAACHRCSAPFLVEIPKRPDLHRLPEQGMRYKEEPKTKDEAGG
jgi:hypothetical protein